MLYTERYGMGWDEETGKNTFLTITPKFLQIYIVWRITRYVCMNVVVRSHSSGRISMLIRTYEEQYNKNRHRTIPCLVLIEEQDKNFI